MRKNYYDVKFSLSDIIDENKFVVPQYQRGLSWDPKRRENFIINIRNGEPFGIILVRESNGKYELIDGLQRISTIRHYYTNPFEYLSIDDVSETECKALISLHLKNLGLAEDEKYIVEMTKKARIEIFNCLKSGKENYEAMDIVIESLSMMPEKNLKRKINDIYKEFESNISIESVEVIGINYIGPVENIPNLFYSLNTGGVALSKYDTYAALWSATLFKLEDRDLLKHVSKKYSSVVDESGLELSFDLDSIYEDGITLFEYCYALSEYIIYSKPEYNLLFKRVSKKDQVSPVGFELLTLISNLKVNRTDELYNIFKIHADNPEFLLDLKDIIIDSIDKAVKRLSPILISLTGSKLIPESTYQIYHYIVSIIKNEYIIDFKKGIIHKNPNKLSNKSFNKYSGEVFVYDIIRDYWKLNRQVTDLTQELSSVDSRNRYWEKVSTEQWEVAVNYFIENMNQGRKTIAPNVKVFLNYYSVLKLNQNATNYKFINADYLESSLLKYDFEHIVPLKVIENKIVNIKDSEKDSFPRSSLGNICFLSIKDNRSKKTRTLYEFIEDRPAIKLDDDFLSFVEYPSKVDLGFLAYSSKEFISGYKSFLNNRIFELEQEFINMIRQR